MGARVDDFSEAILKTVLQTKGDEVKPRVTEKIDWQPSYNQKLTRETRLKIPSIKVVDLAIDSKVILLGTKLTMFNTSGMLYADGIKGINYDMQW